MSGSSPVALALSRKANRPVKLVMGRDEVFRATGPTSSTSIDVKMGAKKTAPLQRRLPRCVTKAVPFRQLGNVGLYDGFCLLRH